MSVKEKDYVDNQNSKETKKTAKQADKFDKKASKTAKNAENLQQDADEYSKQYGDAEYYSKKHGKPYQHDCGCNDNNCTCGDDCDCTPENNCGCGGHQHTKGCGGKSEHNQNNGCGCGGHDHGKHKGHNRDEEYAALFAQLQHALEEGEKQLKRARDEAIDNQRLAATYKKDLERYKERTQNIQTEANQNAIESVATNLLPILDQFEVALKATSQNPETQGYCMIYSSLKNMLLNMGVQELDSIGQPFDSNLHNAVSRQKVSDKAKDGMVTAVYQKGYQIKSTGKIIRYAMVEIGEYNK